MLRRNSTMMNSYFVKQSQILNKYKECDDQIDKYKESAKALSVQIETKEKLKLLYLEGLKKIWNSDKDAINRPNLYGTTPFLLACKDNEELVVKAMLNHKADPACTDNAGDNALHYALRGENYSVAIFLLNLEGQNFDKPNAKDETPLMYVQNEVKRLEEEISRLEEGVSYSNLEQHNFTKESIYQEVSNYDRIVDEKEAWKLLIDYMSLPVNPEDA